MGAETKNEIWLEGIPEERLAQFQQSQGRSNHCGEFAAAAALALLTGRVITGKEMVKFADRGWLKKGLRSWPGGPTTPAQQTRLVREYARRQDLPLEAEAHHSTLFHLRRWLEQPGTACLVTIAWNNRQPPRITNGAGRPFQVARSPFFWAGHTMLLAAHQSTAGYSGERWGFINSWAAAPGGASICWMEQAEFKRCWEYPLFPIGARNVVVIRKKKSPQR